MSTNAGVVHNQIIKRSKHTSQENVGAAPIINTKQGDESREKGMVICNKEPRRHNRGYAPGLVLRC